LEHPCYFQRVSRLGSVTARHCNSGRQPNFAALNRGRHLYSAWRRSRWASVHILILTCFFPSCFFSSPIIQRMQIGCRIPHFYTWYSSSANLECRSEMCCAGNTGRKKSPKIRHLGTITQLCRAISSQPRHVSTIGKNCQTAISPSPCRMSLQNGELRPTSG